MEFFLQRSSRCTFSIRHFERFIFYSICAQYPHAYLCLTWWFLGVSARLHKICCIAAFLNRTDFHFHESGVHWLSKYTQNLRFDAVGPINHVHFLELGVNGLSKYTGLFSGPSLVHRQGVIFRSLILNIFCFYRNTFTMILPRLAASQCHPLRQLREEFQRQ